MQTPDSEPTKKLPNPPANGAGTVGQKHWRSDFSRYFLPAYILLIVYVSLSPFSGWRQPDQGALAFLQAPWPRYITIFDMSANVLAYVPLGVLLFDWVRRWSRRGVAIVIACLMGCLLSFTMESLQAYLPARISALIDFMTNSTGTFLGALLAARTGQSALIRWLSSWRRETFNEGPGSEFGEVLLVIWLLTQLNPSIPFFAAGTINSALSAEWDVNYNQPLYHLPQGIAVALNLCGFGLFVSVLLKPAVKTLWFVVAVVVFGTFLKMLAGGVLLKQPVMLDWFGKESFAGVIGGLVFLGIAAGRSHHWRIYIAAMTILAGGLLAKVVAIYDAFPNILRVFDWPYGQLFNFTSLTLLLNEFWPLVTLIYLLVVFNHLPSSDMPKSDQGN
ncbi:MAG: VanZ family protein [Pseudomonadota bacterium]